MSSQLDCDSICMGSIPAVPDARNVPLLLCHERYNEASLPDRLDIWELGPYGYVGYERICLDMPGYARIYPDMFVIFWDLGGYIRIMYPLRFPPACRYPSYLSYPQRFPNISVQYILRYPVIRSTFYPLGYPFRYPSYPSYPR